MIGETGRDAGQLLADQLSSYADTDTVVLGLSGRGIVVGHEVAQTLRLPFDALIVHRITTAGCQGLAVGVVVEPDHVAVNHRLARTLDLPEGWSDEAVVEGIREVRRRGTACRKGRERLTVTGRRAIIVDDAASTGTTLHAAVTAIRNEGAREIIVAVPVAPRGVIDALSAQADRVVCLAEPAHLIWQGIHYLPAHEVDDATMSRLLRQGGDGEALDGASAGSVGAH